MIGTHRRPASLRTTLASIAKVEFDKDTMEVIVVLTANDAETRREIPQMIEELGNSMEVQTVTISEDLATKARNAGVRISNSDFVAVIDDDVYIHPRTLTRALELLSGNGRIGAVTFPFLPRSSSDSRAPSLFYRVNYMRSMGKVSVTRSVGMVTVYKRDVLLEVGMYREDMGPPITIHEDWELASRMRRHGYVILLDGTTPQTHMEESEGSSRRLSAGGLQFLTGYVRNHAKRDSRSMAQVLLSGPRSMMLELIGYILLPAVFLALAVEQPVIGLVFGLVVLTIAIASGLISGSYTAQGTPAIFVYPILLILARTLRSLLFVIYLLGYVIPSRVRSVFRSTRRKNSAQGLVAPLG